MSVQARERDSAVVAHGGDSRIAEVAEAGGELVSRGSVAGFVGGVGFLLANMAFATTQGLPAVAPMIDISTIFHGVDTPTPSPENMVVGLVTHTGLSILFGIGFALLVTAVPTVRRAPLLVVAAIAYGLLLYLVNFQILGRTLFPWFTNPEGPNQGFEVFIHAVYGLMLVPFFLAPWRRVGVRA